MVCAKSAARIFLCENAHHKICIKQDKQRTYSVTLWCAHVIMAMETQQCVPFVLLTYTCQCQQYNTYTAVQMQ